MFAAFQAYDKNGDGTLTADELMGILLNPRTGTPMTLSDAEEFVAYADTNGERKGNLSSPAWVLLLLIMLLSSHAYRLPLISKAMASWIMRSSARHWASHLCFQWLYRCFQWPPLPSPLLK